MTEETKQIAQDLAAEIGDYLQQGQERPWVKVAAMPWPLADKMSIVIYDDHCSSPGLAADEVVRISEMFERRGKCLMIFAQEIEIDGRSRPCMFAYV